MRPCAAWARHLCVTHPFLFSSPSPHLLALSSLSPPPRSFLPYPHSSLPLSLSLCFTHTPFHPPLRIIGAGVISTCVDPSAGFSRAAAHLHLFRVWYHRGAALWRSTPCTMPNHTLPGKPCPACSCPPRRGPPCANTLPCTWYGVSESPFLASRVHVLLSLP